MPKKKPAKKPVRTARHASSPKSLAHLSQEIAFLNSILDNLPNMVFLKDAKDLRFVRFNKAGEEIIGYKEKEMIGKNDYNIFPKDEADFFTQKDREVLRSREMIDITEEPIQTRSKGLRILHTKKRGLYDAKGKPVYLLGVSEDITEKKENEARLAESEKRLALALQTSGIGTWSWHIQPDRVVWDENTYRLFGISSKKFKPTLAGFLKLVHPKDHKRVEKSIMESVASAREFNTDYAIIRPDGTEKSIAVRSLIDRDAEGAAVSMTGICWDITEQQQKYSVEIKSEMISMVSHELRTPVHTIKESLSVILEGLTGSINDEQRDVLETAKNCIDRLTRLINNVLNFQKMEAGIVDMTFEKHDLNDLVRSIVEIERPAANGKKLALELQLTQEPLEAEIDSDKIIQVLTNLIHNAIKFTEKGSVTVSTELLSDGARIAIEDTGIGFSPSEAERIFLKFGQTELSKKMFPQGTGLGLAISRKIIAQHRGRIWAESKKPLGSIFSIFLPLRQPKNA